MAIQYFAYGSNLLPARLQARCPSAVAVEIATACGYELRFTKPSIDGSGKATLSPSALAETPGVIFEIADRDIDALDRAEGAGKGYDRKCGFEVQSQNSGSLVPVATYLATVEDETRVPFDWYLGLVVAGALHHSLAPKYIAMLRQSSYLPDLRFDRPARAEALELLKASGFSGAEQVLRSDS